jgi:hypothetical protein
MTIMNPVVEQLKAALTTAPYDMERTLYKAAIAEITRLSQLLNHTEESDPVRVYEGTMWHADESSDTVRIFRGHMQIAKCAKRGTPYEEYWPTPEQLTWMLHTLNQAELTNKADPS